MHRELSRLKATFLVCALATLAIATTNTPADAQSVANANIRGRVTDTTDAPLPGVTVNATSPALIVTQVTTTTDGDGSYTLPDLPIGTYTITYELTGFQRLVRQEIRLTAGFTAELNIALGVGSVSETVTVVGASPVVDTSSTTPSVNLSSEFLVEVLPVTRRIQDILSTTPGITTRFPSDLAGGTSGGGAYRTYGIVGQTTMLLDGVNTRQDAVIDQGTGNSPDIGTLEEMQIVTSGGGAEVALPGVFLNMIVKSGGDTFHGRYEAMGVHKRFQDNNITPALRAQGLNVGDAFNFSGEVTGDLGGRIIRNKLWFYGAARYRDTERTALGFAKETGPDGRWATGDDVPGVLKANDQNRTLKLTYQASSKYKVIGMYAIHTEDFDPYPPGNPPRNNPYPTSYLFSWDPMQVKGEIQGTPSNRFLFNFMIGDQRPPHDWQAQPFATGPRSFDVFTGLTQGPANALFFGGRNNWGPSGSVSFFPPSSSLGRHEIKAGGSLMLQYLKGGINPGPHGPYLLILNNGNPLQLITYNYPVLPITKLNEGGLFVQDTWRVGDRTTFNIGLRYDHFHSFVPEQVKEQGRFGTSGTYPRVEAATWKEIAPRFGVAYDLSGNGKTVLKGVWGRYNHSPGDAFAADYNQNTTITTTYRWSDPNRNGDFDPGEVDLNTNGPDFVSIAGASNNVINPDLEAPRSYETVLSLDQELMNDFGARIGYIYLRQSKLYSNVNVLRPYQAYDLVIPRQDPGPDGLLGTGDDGGIVNVYDFGPAYRGAAFVRNMRVTRPSEVDPKLHTIEAVLTKRQSGKWGMLASASASKNDSYLDDIITTPNQEYFNKNDTWNWETKISGSLELPYKVILGAMYQVFNGVPMQRTNLFTGLPSGTNVTLRLEPLGTRKGPLRDLLNLRVARDFPLTQGKRLRGSVEILNALNSASPWTLTNASGPSFGYWGTIDSPRLARGSISFTF